MKKKNLFATKVYKQNKDNFIKKKEEEEEKRKPKWHQRAK